MAPAQTETLDLKPFCAEEKSRRQNISEPFSRAEFTYATNGTLMVRVPRRDDVPERSNAPHAERVWPKEWRDDFRAVRFSRIANAERITCDGCEGRCTEHDCPDCSHECPTCGGEGTIEIASAVELGHREITPRAARLLQLLPEIKISLPATDDDNLLQFQFVGGQGILMMLKRNHVRAVLGSIEVAEPATTE